MSLAHYNPAQDLEHHFVVYKKKVVMKFRVFQSVLF